MQVFNVEYFSRYAAIFIHRKVLFLQCKPFWQVRERKIDTHSCIVIAVCTKNRHLRGGFHIFDMPFVLLHRTKIDRPCYRCHMF